MWTDFAVTVAGTFGLTYYTLQFFKQMRELRRVVVRRDASTEWWNATR